MTVQQLINKLEKMPKRLQIFQADHDHGLYETSGKPGQVILINKDEMTFFENDKEDICFQNTPKKYVVIRPL